MATIVTRSGKGSALTHNEVDANFNNLNTGKLEIPSGGSADQVLTYASAGTAQWADAGGAFAASTVTVSDHTTLTAAQNGNLINVTATGEKIISLPAAAEGAFYVFNNDTSHIMYIKPNGTNTINGFTASLSLAPAASGILACGGSSTNWSSVGMTRTMVVAKATTFFNTLRGADDGTRLTGTYTPILGSSLLICVGSGCAGSSTSAGSPYNYKSGGGGGQSYAEKFIASPASSYSYDIPAGPTRNGHSASYDKTTTAAGMTCTPGPDSPGPTHSNNNVSGRAGGTASGGTVNFTGGAGASPSTSYTGGGGGAATRAGNGGNGAVRYGGGTGGNNASSSAVGAAASARDNSTSAFSGSTSETYLAGTDATTDAASFIGYGAGPKTVVNFGSVNFTIADHSTLIQGGTRGGGTGGYTKHGLGGYVTFVEFI